MHILLPPANKHIFFILHQQGSLKLTASVYMIRITTDGFVRKAITPFRIAATIDDSDTPIGKFRKSAIFDPFLISLIESFIPEYRIGPFKLATGIKIDTYLWENPKVTITGPTAKLNGHINIDANWLFLHDIAGKRTIILDHASLHKFSPPQQIIFNSLSSISDIVRTWASTQPFAHSITRGWIDYAYMTCDEILAALKTAMFLETPIKDILHQFLMRVGRSGIEKCRQYYRWDVGFKNFHAKDEILIDILNAELGPPPYTPEQLMLH